MVDDVHNVDHKLGESLQKMFKQFVKVEKLCICGIIVVSTEQFLPCQVESRYGQDDRIQQTSQDTTEHSADEVLAGEEIEEDEEATEHHG